MATRAKTLAIVAVLLLIFLFLARTSPSAVGERGGLLTQDETWSGEVRVVETVIVPEGVTLTIAPGTMVKFRHYRGYKEPKVGLVVEGGTVKALGTAERQIWFTSDAEDPINGDWGGISISGSRSSEFDYVIVEYGEIGIEQFHSQANVSNSILRWNNSEGLYAETSRAVFRNNTIYGNAYHAIALENYNEQIEILSNIIDGAGRQGVHIENSNARVEGNYFKNFDVSEAAPEKVISVIGRSHAVVRRNKFEIYGGDNPFAVDPESTLIEEDNDFGDGHIPPPEFDYQDVRITELEYLPGDPEDRYLYVYDEVDETRRIVGRYGKGLGLSWSLAYADGGVWRFTPSGAFIKINPVRGVDYAHEYANPMGLAPRGLTYDGEFFWANDHVRLKIVKFKLGTGGGYPDVGSGNAIEIVDEFDLPEKELGGGAGIATDGEYLYVPSIADATKLYQLDKRGNVIKEIHFEGPIGPAIAWDGTHFWSAGGLTINKWTKDGKLVGAIYPPAVETWDITWDGEYLWTINRTCEDWDDAKVFRIEILDETAILGGPGPEEPPESAAGSQTFTIAIKAAEVGEPISEYIYGAFIEHQGRCIYDGIWAEMLQDRKFFYPVNYYFPWGEQKHKSPWRAIPFDTVVVMDTANAFVGEHSPRIDLDGRKPRGIMQDGLGLQKDREYEGYLIAAGSSAVTAEVRLVWGPGPEGRQTVTLGPLSSAYTKMPFRFVAGADTDDGRLEILGRGQGSFYIGAVSLMPADNVYGMRADTIALLKDLNFTVYRWPGGIFVNDYDWREAIGDRDKRPPRLNRAYWSEDIESNDFGLDEFMKLCEVLKAEPYVVVSATSPGDAQMAAEEVEYLNGSLDTPMGRLRAANGHPEPYGVKFWGVGNEMWGFMPLEDYIEQHNRIAAAMRAADPSIKIIAVGGVDLEGLQPGHTWAEDMLAHSADYMDLISEHIYGGSSPNLIEHTGSIAQGIRWFVEAHRRYRERLPSLQGKDIRLAFDEWNYSWEDRAEIYGEAGPRYYFKDALGIARGLHEMIRNSDMVAMANLHAVNVHGQVKTTKTAAAIEATGLAFKLYRQHFGTLPVAVHGDLAPLDVVAAWTQDHRALTLAVVNPTEYAHTLVLMLENAQLTGTGQLWLISSSDPMAYNEPGEPPQVTIEERQLSGIVDRLSIPPLSISLYELKVR